jgi:anti-sigma B factor antagonist
MEVVGDVGVLRISGDVDHVSAPELQTLADKLLNDGARCLVFDCRAVDFVDSAGLRVFLQAHQRTHAQGGTVTMRRPRPFLVRLMQITALDSVLQVDCIPEAERASS